MSSVTLTASTAFALLCAGCGSTQTYYLTPWLRCISHKAVSWDSGGAVKTSVEVQRGQGWSALDRAHDAVVLEGGKRAAVRTSDDGIVIVTAGGAQVPVPSCNRMAAITTPDRRNIACFERGLMPLGFVGDVLLVLGQGQRGAHAAYHRLISVRATGETTTEERVPNDQVTCAPAPSGSAVDCAQIAPGFNL